MIINLTLIIQAINFFVFYLLLRVFLFRPVLAVIESDNTREQVLYNQIDQQNKDMDTKREEQELLFTSFRQSCKKNFPQQLASLPVLDIPESDQQLTDVLFDEKSLQSLVEALRNSLEKEIKNVH